MVEVLLSARTRAQDPAAVALVKDCLINTNRAALRNAVRSVSLHRVDLTDLLPQVPVPTLFITGAEHQGFSPLQARIAANLLPEGSSAVIADAAYLVPLEAPDETARLIRQFWSTHTATRPASPGPGSEA